MATKVRIELNIAGFNAVRRSPEVRSDLKRRAEAIAAQAGEGFEVIETDNPSRAGAMVVAATKDARLAEATEKVLTKAINAGRG